MKQLIESCRKAIESGRCLGCTALENESFVGNINCIYSKIPSAEGMKQIKLNLRNGEKMKILAIDPRKYRKCILCNR